MNEIIETTKCTGAIVKGEVIMSAVELTVKQVPEFLLENRYQHVIIKNTENVVKEINGLIWSCRNLSYLLGS